MSKYESLSKGLNYFRTSSMSKADLEKWVQEHLDEVEAICNYEHDAASFAPTRDWHRCSQCNLFYHKDKLNSHMKECAK